VRGTATERDSPVMTALALGLKNFAKCVPKCHLIGVRQAAESPHNEASLDGGNNR